MTSLEDLLARQLDVTIRAVIREELRRIAAQMSSMALEDLNSVRYEVQPYKDRIEEQAHAMNRVAGAIMTALDMEDTP